MSVARERIVKSWQASEAGEIDEEELRDLKRRKRDYEGYDWQNMLKKYELAQLDDPLSQFLFDVASEKGLSAEKYYVLLALMSERLEESIELREETSKERMRLIGKGYTAYVKAHGVEPSGLQMCASKAETIFAIRPETGEKENWVYVGSGPAEIRGGNRYRLIAYSPFLTGSANDKRWVVYKGGMLGEWKDETIQKQVAAMHLENMSIVRELESKTAKSKETEVRADTGKVAKQKQTLRIEIRELW
ncbi:MAG: hypothetical protein ACSHX2_12100 [Rubritalea sp.]